MGFLLLFLDGVVFVLEVTDFLGEALFLGGELGVLLSELGFDVVVEFLLQLRFELFEF